MSEYIRPLKYLGCKYKYLSTIEEYLKKSKKRILIDPFMGSGVIAVNFSKYFDKVYINDIDKNLTKILKGFKKYTYKEYSQFIKVYEKHLNNLKNKDFYYKFRDHMNNKWFNTDTFYESFFLYHIAFVCINSMFRCGKNGFNQSFGNRKAKILNEQQYNEIHDSLKNVEIYSLDYKLFFKELNKNKIKPENVLMFLDPPYDGVGGFYDEKVVPKVEYRKLLNNDCDILYTDVYDSSLNMPYVNLRKMVNVTPGNGRKTKNEEVLYYKIKGV